MEGAAVLSLLFMHSPEAHTAVSLSGGAWDPPWKTCTHPCSRVPVIIVSAEAAAESSPALAALGAAGEEKRGSSTCWKAEWM